MSLLHNHNNMQDKSHRRIELQQDRVQGSGRAGLPGFSQGQSDARALISAEDIHCHALVLETGGSIIVRPQFASWHFYNVYHFWYNWKFKLVWDNVQSKIHTSRYFIPPLSAVLNFYSVPLHSHRYFVKKLSNIWIKLNRFKQKVHVIFHFDDNETMVD